MRTLALALIFVSALAAQRGGGFRGGGFRGGGGHAFGRGGFVHRPGFSGFIGGGHHRGIVGGFRFGFGAHRWHRSYPFHSFGRAYWGGSYYPNIWYGGSPFWSSPIVYSPPAYYPYSYSTGPAVMVITAPVAAEASQPAIIINSDRSDRDIRLREAPQRRATRSPLYLIAGNDGLIWAAVAYWIENDVLHFMTSKNERKQIPLAQVDRALTDELNRERGVASPLP